MLQLIIGRSGSGKTTELYRLMREAAETDTAPLFLLVPEQASFDNERRLLKEFGPILSQRVQVLSFTRLANAVFHEIGGLSGKRMDSTLSMLLMSQALHSVADSLSLYRRHVDNAEYLQTLLSFLSECKQCTITPDMLDSTAKTLPSGSILRSKAEDTALIFGAYEGLIAQSQLIDPLDELTVVAERLPECTLFNGAHIYVDAFKGFTEQELRVLDRLIARVNSVTVCLCTDTATQVNTFGRFATAARTATRLRDMASRHHVPIAAVKHLKDNHRTADPALLALEKGCFIANAEVCDEPTESVCVTPCADRAAECRYAAREIRRLLRENGGYARDFTVVVRDSAKYNDLFAAALEREGLPCTLDVREPVTMQPLVTLIESALAAALHWDSADVLRLAKTGLCGFSATSAAMLENYVFLWNIRSKQWKLPFTSHPEGMQTKMDAYAAERLQHINRLRDRLAAPLIHLQSRLDGTHTGKEFSVAVWSLLQELRVPRMVRFQAARLKAEGDVHAAEQQARLWEYVVTLLDKFALLSTPQTLKQFADLWHLAVANDDLGSIPPTLDGVKLGGADRIRYTAPKTVFILGANEGEFPAYPSANGLISDHERRQLTDAGLPMADNADQRTAEERYYAYAALAAPSERLVVTYVKRADGEAKHPSSLIENINRLLPQHACGNATGGVTESAADAFHRLSSLWNDNTAESASLRAVFDEHATYADRLAAITRAKDGFVLQDKALAKKLFGERLSMSPSQVETYYSCRFSHFCEYGLQIQPRARAALGAAEAGTLTHYIMSALFPTYAKRQFADCTREVLHEDVSKAVIQYVDTFMGGTDNQDSRFRGLLVHLTRFCEELMWRVVAEMKESRFVPVDYELPIGKDEGIPSWTLQTPDGTVAEVHGKVDRVDVLHEKERSYVRIIDYKTGSKTFDLAEVLAGLNLQMLIYLFAICECGQARYGNVSPAGILYLQARLPVVKIDGEISPDALEKKRLQTMKMNGLLIDNPEILRAMEADLKGVFIPASTVSSGELSSQSSLASLEQFGQLHRHIEKLLTQMATELHNGAVDAVPAGGIADGCLFCKYHDICCHEEQDPVREVVKRSLKEALDELEKEDEQHE